MVTATLKTIAKRARSQVERYIYRGDAVNCIVCGYRARSWLRGQTYGRCPNCRCASRTRVLWRYLERTYTSPQQLKVLHFAPEAPLRARLTAWGAASYTTCDYNRSDVDCRVDIQKLRFADGAYDLVLCSHVLEHIPDHGAAMRELHRICSPNGHVLIQVPLDRAMPTREDLTEMPVSERKRLFGEIDHLRYYGSDFAELLKRAGFSRVTTHEPVREIVITERIEYGFNPEEALFVCQRSAL
ncbi:MAG TPA: class I SAM-dependent methyltransferase [Kofleriaceae bacterium]|nr:class I SAM-dependent methyltransferase [Kofleriaceae bacterium]